MLLNVANSDTFFAIAYPRCVLIFPARDGAPALERVLSLLLLEDVV